MSKTWANFHFWVNYPFKVRFWALTSLSDHLFWLNVKEQHEHSAQHPFWCSTEDGTTWRWVNDDRLFIFPWTILLIIKYVLTGCDHVMSCSNFTLGVDRQIACCWNLIASHLVRTECKAKAKMPTLFKPSRLWDCVPFIHLSSGGQDQSDFTEHTASSLTYGSRLTSSHFILFYFSYFLGLSVCVCES